MACHAASQASETRGRAVRAPGGADRCALTSHAKARDFHGQDLTDRNFNAEPAGSLEGANFSGAKLNGAVFAGQDLTDADFTDADLGPSPNGAADFTGADLDHTCFRRAALLQADLTHAKITCADFSDTKLTDANFGPTQAIVPRPDCRTKFIRSAMAIDLISRNPSGDDNWKASDFSDARFQVVQGFTLAGRDISGAKLRGVDLSKLDLTGANLTDADLEGATLNGAILRHAALNGASLRGARATNADFTCVQAYSTNRGRRLPDGKPCPEAPASGDELGSLDAASADLTLGDFTGALLDHAVFRGANLTQTTFDGASLGQALLQGGTVPGGGSVVAAIVRAARFWQANLTSAQIASVDFSGCDLRQADFTGTTLDHTEFRNAELSKADFSRANIQGADFGAADLTLARFTGSTISASHGEGSKGTSFVCAHMGGVDLGDAGVSQTNFSNAVLPAADDCCPAAHEGAMRHCGFDPASRSAYGPAVLPILKPASSNVCPDGSRTDCEKKNWRLSPDWTTSACSPDAQPRRMWTKPNCAGEKGETVDIRDAALKACVLESLSIGGADIPAEAALRVRSISCPGRKIGAIAGLERFSNLDKLDLSSNQLTQFDLRFVDAGGRPLGASHLTSLKLDHNKLTSLALRTHPSLRVLNASHNELSGVALSADARLLNLDLSFNRIRDFDLSVETDLASADLSNNQLVDVLGGGGDLGAASQVSYLNLSHNDLKTIGGIAKLVPKDADLPRADGSLVSLYLDCNARFQCSTLDLLDGDVAAIRTSTCVQVDPVSRKPTYRPHPSCSR